jgi:hypothetical protein
MSIDPAPSGDDANLSRFPFINLQKAVERAKTLFEAAGDHEMTAADAFQSWGYSAKSSGGFQTVGALRLYGLLTGLRGSNRLSLTPMARNYFRDERPEEKARLLREFAVAPTLFGTLWVDWGPTPPADHIARSHLKIDRGLSEQSARTVLGIYKENVDFAKLKADNKGLGMGAGTERGESGEISGLSDSPIPRVLPPKKGLTLMEGERELTTGLLAKDASFRLIVSGPIGVKEIERLIKKLELDKEILAEADVPAETESLNVRLLRDLPNSSE